MRGRHVISESYISFSSSEIWILLELKFCRMPKPEYDLKQRRMRGIVPPIHLRRENKLVAQEGFRELQACMYVKVYMYVNVSFTLNLPTLYRREMSLSL